MVGCSLARRSAIFYEWLNLGGRAYDLTFGLRAMSGTPRAVSLVSFAVAVYAHRMLPRFTAHLSVAAAAAHLLLLAGFIVHNGPLSLEGFSITGIPALLWAWILATALAMPRDA